MFLKNRTFNIQYVFKDVMPSDRSCPDQRAKYNAYIFSFALGSLYYYKTINNYKEQKVRQDLCSKLGISERTFHRYLKSALEHGFVYPDENNKNTLRIKGNGKLVDFNNEKCGDFGKKHPAFVWYYYKCKLRINTIKFSYLKDLFDTACLRYFNYTEETNVIANRKTHIHKSQKFITSNPLLSYEETEGGYNTHGQILSFLHNMILSSLREHRIKKNLDKVVYGNPVIVETGSGKKVDGTRYSDREIRIVERQVYNRDVHQSMNSAVISFYKYYAICNIDRLYLNDQGSKQRGEALGFTKSGFNSFMDRVVESGLVERNPKYAYIDSCSYEDYQRMRTSISEFCKWQDDRMLPFLNRIVYKHGCVLFQRENHIKINSQIIKFIWDRSKHSFLINENDGIIVNQRYFELCKKLGIKPSGGWYTPNIKSPVKDNKLIIGLVGESTGKVYNSYKKLKLSEEYRTPEQLALLATARGLEDQDGKIWIYADAYKKYYNKQTNKKRIVQIVEYEREKSYSRN